MIAPEPFFQTRGTPFSIYHRLKALSRLGHEVDLLTYHLGEDAEFPGVRICRIPKVPFIRHGDGIILTVPDLDRAKFDNIIVLEL